MIKKIQTLRKNSDIVALMRRGLRSESEFLRVVCRKNDVGHARFLFVVPKSLDKRAVVRNTIRRRIREWVRKQEYLITKSVDIAFLPKKGASQAPRKFFYEELEKTISRC